MVNGGYKEKAYWTAEGWEWCVAKEKTEPAYWHDRRFNCPNAPVVGVSWYEVVAFTNWLTAYLQDGYSYRLPKEEEWQLAAGGKGQTEYPWGNGWDKDKCNSIELSISKTSAVGIFLAGSTPIDDERAEEIMDMAGNVWEWTDSYYDKDKDSYTIRGGAWFSSGISCRCTFRFFNPPQNGNYVIGFRCVKSFSI